MSIIEIKIPDIGDFSNVAVIELLVKVGDRIRTEQSLITVESDKAAMEIPSSQSGVVTEMKVALGDRVSQGTVVLLLNVADDANVANMADLATTRVNQASVATNAVVIQESPMNAAPQGLPHASPSVRQLARELGVPLTAVTGSGPRGRITHEDVQSAVSSVPSLPNTSTHTPASTSALAPDTVKVAGVVGLDVLPWPQIDFAQFGSIERKELSRIQKISAANLSRNAIVIPAVTLHDDADVTDLEAFRVSINLENKSNQGNPKQSDTKVTLLAFLVKACAAALKQYPDFNSSLDGNTLIRKNYFHLGFATDTPHGLMVPVIRSADQKGILQISRELSDLSQKAREGKIGPSDLSGGNFTITSLGGIGGRYFTPIINAPEVAILGVCRATTQPVWDGKAFAPRLMLPLSLTFDHRVIDGAAAARFMVYLAKMLSDFRRVML